MKFKVTYYQDAKPIVKDVEANEFVPVTGRNGELVALFTDEYGSDSKRTFAFSSVISVEKIKGE